MERHIAQTIFQLFIARYAPVLRQQPKDTIHIIVKELICLLLNVVFAAAK